MAMKFKFLEHTADAKFIAYGDSLENVFENSCLAFYDYVCESKKISGTIKKTIGVSGKNNEEILYKFIDELVYLLDTEGFVCSKVRVKFDGKKMVCNLVGANVTNARHVKAATYSEMHVKKKTKGWEAQVVLDI